MAEEIREYLKNDNLINLAAVRAREIVLANYAPVVVATWI